MSRHQKSGSSSWGIATIVAAGLAIYLVDGNTGKCGPLVHRYTELLKGAQQFWIDLIHTSQFLFRLNKYVHLTILSGSLSVVKNKINLK